MSDLPHNATLAPIPVGGDNQQECVTCQDVPAVYRVAISSQTWGGVESQAVSAVCCCLSCALTWLSQYVPRFTKICVDCKQEFPVNERGSLVIPFVPPAMCPQCGQPLQVEYHEGWVSYGCRGHIGGASSLWQGFSSTYCPNCKEERRKKNRQAYPLCPMCGTPTRRYDFLREYQGYRLDLIKVCCENCIPQFEALSEAWQVERLRRAMVRAYGETASIYCLHYDSDKTHHNHIGRTKHLARRMADYRRDWYKEIVFHHVLEELPHGGLSMERESRWMLHALKQGWPIDNFELLKLGEDGQSGKRQQVLLTEAVQAFEPLTAPFETIEPLLREFLNTSDARIVHWLVERLGARILPA